MAGIRGINPRSGTPKSGTSWNPIKGVSKKASKSSTVKGLAEKAPDSQYLKDRATRAALDPQGEALKLALQVGAVDYMGNKMSAPGGAPGGAPGANRNQAPWWQSFLGPNGAMPSWLSLMLGGTSAFMNAKDATRYRGIEDEQIDYAKAQQARQQAMQDKIMGNLNPALNVPNLGGLFEDTSNPFYKPSPAAQSPTVPMGGGPGGGIPGVGGDPWDDPTIRAELDAMKPGESKNYGTWGAGKGSGPNGQTFAEAGAEQRAKGAFPQTPGMRLQSQRGGIRGMSARARM